MLILISMPIFNVYATLILPFAAGALVSPTGFCPAKFKKVLIYIHTSLL